VRLGVDLTAAHLRATGMTVAEARVSFWGRRGTVAEAAEEYAPGPLTGHVYIVLRTLGDAQGDGESVPRFASRYEDSAAVRQLVEWGYVELPHVKKRGRLRFGINDLDAWMERDKNAVR